MTHDASPLGRQTDYPDRYDASLLFSMPRAPLRTSLGVTGSLPFAGVDLWTAYEITWLDARGKPELAVGRFRVPADSPQIFESKSLKLYLGSFAQEKLEGGRSEVAARIESDLARASGAFVAVELADPSGDSSRQLPSLPGDSLDGIELVADVYEPAPEFLATSGGYAEETLRSALFRSLCPVTGQPDFGDVMIRYRGQKIARSGLLRYLISYRRHAAFHENCVERMFVDILRMCAPQSLTVYARFLRRGGIEINPFRSNFEAVPPHDLRTVRQ
jgi:7-cyano-7-deazaguanine reductase